MRFFAASACSLASLASFAAASGQDHTLFSYTPKQDNSGLGSAIKDAGDVDRDGLQDFLFSSGDDVLVVSGANGTTLLTLSAPAKSSDYFGAAVSGAGDVNADGFPDLIVGAHEDDDFGKESGSAWVFSGVDGSILHTFFGDEKDDHLGVSVAGVGDLDQDGCADVIVGAVPPLYPFLPDTYVRVFSGRTGTLLHEIVGTGEDRFGLTVDGLSDLSGDGVPDFIVGVPFDSTNMSTGFWRGSARVFSGADASSLHVLWGDAASDFLGYAVADAGDVNGDGIGDFAAGAWGADQNGDGCGSIRLYSGANGSVIRTIYGDYAFDRLGVALDGAGDVDGDGYADLVAGIPYDSIVADDAGAVRVYSGADGSTLWIDHGDASWNNFGYAVSGLGDVNRDGASDYVTSSPYVKNAGNRFGVARVYSGAALELVTDLHEISLAAGGTQTLSLDAGPGGAGLLYFLLGTLTGTTPGLDLMGVHLPLNFDAYFLLTLRQPNVPPLGNSLGTLDGAGTATATFALPPGLDPSLAGITLHHAAIVLNGPGKGAYLATNAASVALVD